MAKKRRVFQIARELELSNEAVITFLGKKDKSIQNQMSAVGEDLYDAVCEQFKQEAPTSDALDFRQQLKEKQLMEELRRNKARMDLEERIRFATKIAEERPHRLKKSVKAETEELLKQKVESVIEETPVATSVEKEADEVKDELSFVELISKAKKEIDREAKEAKSDKEDTEKEAKVKVVEVDGKAKGIEGDVKSKDDKTIKDKKEVSEEKTDAVVTKPDDGKKDKDKDKQKGKKKKKRKISEEEIQESIRQTLASMDEVKSKRRKRKSKDSDLEIEEDDKNIIKVSEFISAAELADLMNVGSGDVITKSLELGMMISINQRLDINTIVAVADEFGYEVEIIQEYGSEIIDEYEEEDANDEGAVPRSPVVTIMGHVDHGKTSLLDYIRESNIIGGEAGGITQHIGAYEVTTNGKTITFLDTPGHEAFTAMRARGAQVTDLVVLIVAADDGVQPQTVEAINHALAAEVPIVIAINKIDKPDSNSERVKKELSVNNILVEGWGGKYQSVEVSAKTGVGIDKLLELILLEAEILELKANPNRRARGSIIESRLDRGKGAIATVLVHNGTLNVGDLFIAGQFSGKVRAMYDERKRKAKSAPPSTPIQVVGFDGVPQAGDAFVVLESEREVREISSKRQQLKREQDFRRRRHVSLDDIAERVRHGEVKELNIILKSDVDGSNEALSDSLMKLSNDEVAVNVIHKGVGGISESDVLLATASEAIILGFHVRPTIQARELAKKDEIDIRLYDIIYAAIEDVKSALEGLLDPEITEELTSTIEVRETFKVPKIGTIAGCYVLSGKASRSNFIKIYRDDKLLHETKIASLKRFKDDVKEVNSGFECGISLEGFDDIKVSDIFETHKEVKTARKLE